MKIYLVLVIASSIQCATSINAIFGKIRLKCFPVVGTPACNQTLSQSFTPKHQPVGANSGETYVYLFTPTSQDKAEPLHLCGGRLPPGSTYDPNANTEIFIHGWLDGVCRTAWMREMKEQLFIRGKYNVILVDWSWGNSPDYYEASQNLKSVGEQVGFVINNIMRQTGSSSKQFHVIGHSFGAIASGFVGRSVKGLRRITALDPAFAPFQNAPPKERLTYRDADLVDVIHSNGGSCAVLALGDERALGHADFYPNGGTIQKSCYSNIIPSILKLDLAYALFSIYPVFCFHFQAIQFYKVSINPGNCQFVGIASKSYASFLRSKTTNCSKFAVMGMDYEKYRARNDRKRRKYYLNVDMFCPYIDDSYIGEKHPRFPFNTSCSTN